MVEKDFSENNNKKKVLRIKRFKQVHIGIGYSSISITFYKSTYNAYFYLVLLCINTQSYTYSVHNIDRC